MDSSADNLSQTFVAGASMHTEAVIFSMGVSLAAE
jgi:hypothetical protein